MKILILSDNGFLIRQFHRLLGEKDLFNKHDWKFACSPGSNTLINDSLPVKPEILIVKNEWTELIKNYDLIFSLHSKQLFPAELVKKVKCINVHPGYNPGNRGWYPQVFSILNKKKAGATIHEMDEQLDHGPVIARKETEIESWDTSLSVYNRVQEAEIQLLTENLENILLGNYDAFSPGEGNVNLKKDFNERCEIKLDKKVTMQESIDYLRAMTHGDYNNAWYRDGRTGKKVFIKIILQPEP